MTLDRRTLLDEIRFHYKFKNNVEFAKFLGITPQNLSNWYRRNSIDIERVYERCKGINPTWLLTGKGSMFGEITEAGKAPGDTEDLRKLLAAKEKIIALYEEKLAKLEEQEEDKLSVIIAQNHTILEYMEAKGIEETIKKARKKSQAKTVKKTKKV